jgi:5-methylcytosine-specific restriction endonuclease McrA
MGDATLVLNADYMPHAIISWREAVVLLVTEKARVLESYSGWEIRSASLCVEVPAVMVLEKYVSFRQKIKFSRANVYARDNYQCQYCRRKAGEGIKVSELTFDHVVPRSAGGETTWENIVTSCRPCNSRKGSTPLLEFGTHLLREPRKPDSISNVIYVLARKEVPSAWETHLSFLKNKRRHLTETKVVHEDF